VLQNVGAAHGGRAERNQMNTPWLDALLKACEQLQFVDLDIRERVLVKAKQEVCAMKMRLEQSIPPARPEKAQRCCDNCTHQNSRPTSEVRSVCSCCYDVLSMFTPKLSAESQQMAQEKPREDV